jgi:hypothetical protein
MARRPELVGPLSRSRARVDGFAFDVEVLWLARQLRLEVAEVQVEAVERPGSKVQMVADALEMLAEVWTVRQAATHRVSAKWDLARLDPPRWPLARPTRSLGR